MASRPAQSRMPSCIDALEKISQDLDDAIAQNDWTAAIAVDRQRYQMLKDLPPAVFASHNPEIRAVLEGILDSARELESRMRVELTQCTDERRKLGKNRYAADRYRSTLCA